MRPLYRFVLPVLLLWACNNRPPEDLAGLYYPATKPKPVDSSEVLRVVRLDSIAFVFSIRGNTGIGKQREGLVSGTLRDAALGEMPFTFRATGKKRYEFRARGGRVELVKL